MILTIQQLLERYQNYVDPKGRIGRDVKAGRLFPVARGLYETNPDIDGLYLAQFIYGPSYVSFDYVLYKQGLIPEAVYKTFTCATYNKNKAKTYTNRFGIYIYRDVPLTVFNYGILPFVVDGYSVQIAREEKALCDKLYTISPVRSLKAFESLLFEDLRIDRARLSALDKDFIYKIAPMYKRANLKWLIKYLEKN